jgi:hypothetical protein
MNERLFLKIALFMWSFKRTGGTLPMLQEAIEKTFQNPAVELETAKLIWACIDDVDGLNALLLEDVARTRGLDLDKLQDWRDAKEHAEARTLAPKEVEA